VMEDPTQPGSEPIPIPPGTLVRRALSGDVTAMHELALTGAPEAFETLTRVVLNSVNDQTRTEAISALGDLKDARTVEFLSGLIVKSKFPVTKACARVLGNTKDPSVIPVLIKTMRLNADWMSSQACVDALGEFAPQAPEEVCAALIEGLELGSFVADSARIALVQYGNAALPSLTAFLDDTASSPFTLRQTIDVIGLIGDPRRLSIKKHLTSSLTGCCR
jgi:HEAT repeat protein